MQYDQDSFPRTDGPNEAPNTSPPAFADMRSPSMQGYPQYTDSIDLHPSREAFDRAWTILFEFAPSECQVSFASDDPKSGLVIRTPDGRTTIHGGFGQYTDKPDLEPGSNFYYSGCGCPWTTDRTGVRYHLIDPKTNLPRDFHEVEADIIVSRYLHEVAAREGTLFLSQGEERGA